MKGHVPTPAAVVDHMVATLFARRPPKADDRLLDPGCGDGPFIDGVLRYCAAKSLPVPEITGVELNPALAIDAKRRFATNKEVRILSQDFLDLTEGEFQFVVGNPPYVRLEGLDDSERLRYRRRFSTAVGRFDLYLLFFEQAIRLLSADGKLVFITPEKFEYVDTAKPLRQILARFVVQQLEHVSEDTFEGLVTYPTITTMIKKSRAKAARTRVSLRDGKKRSVVLPTTGESWNSSLAGVASGPAGLTLGDLCLRISCGIATGTDEVFVVEDGRIPTELRTYAYPTISGRQLGLAGYTAGGRVVSTQDSMLVPYDQQGRLLDEQRVAPLLTYLSKSGRSEKLRSRTHVSRRGRAWYRFHDSVPFPELLLPKIVCKDIAPSPKFWIDAEGKIVPRHSTYYIIPQRGVDLEKLWSYLSSDEARAWIEANAQRAANGFYRLQSTVLKRLPIPARVMSGFVGKGYSVPVAAPAKGNATTQVSLAEVA